MIYFVYCDVIVDCLFYIVCFIGFGKIVVFLVFVLNRVYENGFEEFVVSIVIFKVFKDNNEYKIYCSNCLMIYKFVYVYEDILLIL